MAQNHLFDPLRIRSLELKNRLWVSPMCQYASEHRDGMVEDWHRIHYGSMARGGAGLVMVEATAVLPEGRISPQCLGLWSDAHIEGLRQIVDFAHSQGSAMGIQLAHAGRKASTHAWFPGANKLSVPLESGGWETVAPSALPFWEYREPHALSAEGIDGVVDAFVTAAERASQAGFDVIEIHAAHGYLLHEFLSPFSNTRSDQYGGSLENRARLLRRIVRSIREEHPDLPLFVRISATEWVEGGFTLTEATQVATWLGEDGADLVDVSSGANLPDVKIPVGPGFQVPLSAHIKTESGMRTAAVGFITNAQQADEIVTSGKADAVFVGRPALRDPHIGLTWARALQITDVPVPHSLWRGYAS